MSTITDMRPSLNFDFKLNSFERNTCNHNGFGKKVVVARKFSQCILHFFYDNSHVRISEWYPEPLDEDKSLEEGKV